jgi:hypothetical protein
MYFDVSGLENTSSVDGIKSLSHKLIIKFNLTDFFRMLSFRNVFLVLIDQPSQLFTLTHSSCQIFCMLFLLLNLFCFDAIINFLFFFLYLFFYFLKIMKLLSKLFLFCSLFCLQLSSSLLFISMTNLNDGQFL